MGVNHIGLSVKDLDRTLAFYRSVSGFELVSRQSVRNSAAADQLFGVEDVAYELPCWKRPICCSSSLNLSTMLMCR